MKMVYRCEHRDFKDNLCKIYEYTSLNECDLHEVMQDIRCFLIGSGFSPEGVDQYIEAD